MNPLNKKKLTYLVLLVNVVFVVDQFFVILVDVKQGEDHNR